MSLFLPVAMQSKVFERLVKWQNQCVFRDFLQPAFYKKKFEELVKDFSLSSGDRGLEKLLTLLAAL